MAHIEAMRVATDPAYAAGLTDSDWQDLATVSPDPTGICRYTDTNVGSYPYRFYRTATP